MQICQASSHSPSLTPKEPPPPVPSLIELFKHDGSDRPPSTRRVLGLCPVVCVVHLSFFLERDQHPKAG